VKTFKEFILLIEADAPPGGPPPASPPGGGGAPPTPAPDAAIPPPAAAGPMGGAPPSDAPMDLGGGAGGLAGTGTPTTKAEKLDIIEPWSLLQAWVDQLGKEEKLLKKAKNS
jgi:hypothetical protein